MKPLQRVVWTDGMLMSPQHLQQQDLYHEALLHERIGAVSPYAWGVLSLDTDDEALRSEQVVLRRFHGVLPSGTVISFETSDGERPTARNVDNHFPASQDVLEVYLGLPLERDGAINYATEQEARRSRFEIEPRAVHDRVSADGQLDVEFAKRNVQLFFGDEPRDDLECMKVLEVVRDSTGALAYSEPFVPSVLRLSSSAFLRAGAERLLALATSKQRALARERRQRDASSVEYNASDVTRFLLLNAINTFVPVLRQLAEAGDVTPHAAYLLLIQMAGQLCSFTVDEDPTEVPAYQHHDLRGTFEALFARLTALMRASVPGQCFTVSLDARDDGLHLGQLKDEPLRDPAATYFVSVESQLPETQVSHSVPRVAKVGSWNDIAQFVSSATSGVSVVHEPRPPKEIPLRAGRSYFRMQTDASSFRNVLSERAIAVHLPPPFEPKAVKLELLVVPTGA